MSDYNFFQLEIKKLFPKESFAIGTCVLIKFAACIYVHKHIYDISRNDGLEINAASPKKEGESCRLLVLEA